MTNDFKPKPPPAGYTIINKGQIREGDMVWSIKQGWIIAVDAHWGAHVRGFYGVARAALPGEVKVEP